jgi:outer membrane immunogenic protein
MKRIAIVAAAVSFLFTGAASAADLAARPYTKAPPLAAPAFSWTGFYVGGFVGGAFADSQSVVSDPCGPVGVVVCGAVGIYNGVAPVPFDLSSSVIGGGTVGYNWQVNSFVVGVEAEGGYMRLSGSRIMNPAPGFADTLASTTIGDWYAVFAGRLGVAVNQALFYVKGGAAWTRNTNGVVDSNPLGATINTTTSHDVWGWAAGAGIEYAFTPNWSLKGEYLYLGVAKTFRDTGVVLPAGVVEYVISSNPNIHTAKIGLNYRFGGPVVARS